VKRINLERSPDRQRMSKRSASYVDSRYHVEGWRANIPLFRAIGTSLSILLSVIWITWQGSQWVNDIRSEMREIRSELKATRQELTTKAELKDVVHRFELFCAKAPQQHKTWACTS
jgi:hypothetical protein